LLLRQVSSYISPVIIEDHLVKADIPKPSDAELEILCILWDHQPASVRFVHEELCKRKQVGYTTTLKQMQRMQEKKMIRRTDGDDKTHEYEAILQRDATRNSLFDRLVETAFQGSAMNMVLHAIGRSTTSPEEIRELKKWLNKMEGKKS
jgi:BlaI family transcriptional regulator, penicillinase repressor